MIQGANYFFMLLNYLIHIFPLPFVYISVHFLNRLIIEAQEPHNIIHSNASFSQFSGISSDQLLGCSLSKFISDSENQENVKIHLPETSNNLCGNQKDQAGGVLLCKFTVHKVRSNVAGEDKKSQFSHFVLDFEKVATIEKKRVRMGSVAVVG